MKLGLNLGYWGAGNDADNLALAQEADHLGFAVAWVAEAYGSDAPTVLAFVAAQTTRIDLGSAIFQIPGRTPANCAMTAATLDTLSGGRFRLGLGVSGPQVSEGWHGVRFDKPLARTREYSDIVKLALSRQKVRYEGQHYVLPLPDGPGKALQLTVRPGIWKIAEPRSMRLVCAATKASTVGASEPYASATHATAKPRSSASCARARLSASLPPPQ